MTNSRDCHFLLLGKILKDESTIEENCLKEDDFLVLLVSNANRQKQVKPTESTPVAATAESTSVTKKDLSTESKDDALPQKMTSSVGSEERAGTADSAFAVGSGLEGIILNLMEMSGFERDIVIKALRAAFNNPDRAAEFLFSGHIPETPQAGPPGSIPRPPRGPLNPNSPLAFLGQDPQFQQLKSVIMQNPSMAAPILQQIGAANPRLLQVPLIFEFLHF